jgi:hypothetical protein
VDEDEDVDEEEQDEEDKEDGVWLFKPRQVPPPQARIEGVYIYVCTRTYTSAARSDSRTHRRGHRNAEPAMASRWCLWNCCDACLCV